MAAKIGIQEAAKRASQPPGSKTEEQKLAKKEAALFRADCAAMSTFYSCEDLTPNQKMAIAVMLNPKAKGLTEKEKAKAAGVCERQWRVYKHNPYMAQWVLYLIPHRVILEMPGMVSRLMEDFDKKETTVRDRNITFKNLEDFVTRHAYGGLNPAANQMPGDFPGGGNSQNLLIAGGGQGGKSLEDIRHANLEIGLNRFGVTTAQNTD